MENNNTFTNDTMLSGISFDPVFSDARERWIKERSGIWSIPEPLIKALEDGIKRGIITVVNQNDGAMNCQNTED